MYKVLKWLAFPRSTTVVPDPCWWGKVIVFSTEYNLSSIYYWCQRAAQSMQVFVHEAPGLLLPAHLPLFSVCNWDSNQKNRAPPAQFPTDWADSSLTIYMTDVLYIRHQHSHKSVQPLSHWVRCHSHRGWVGWHVFILTTAKTKCNAYMTPV